MSSAISAPSERLVAYEPTSLAGETKFFQHIKQLTTDVSPFRWYLENARCVLTELGPCACDLYLRRILKDVSETPPSENGSFYKITKESMFLLRDWVFSMPSFENSTKKTNVTSKFTELVNVLKACDPYKGRFRCVIHVQRECIGVALTELLLSLTGELGFILPCVVPQTVVDDPELERSVLDGFHSRKYNVLIVSQSIEDLSVPKVDVIIRFNVIESQVSYAYSRAQCRGFLSQLVHMIEKGNDAQRRTLSRVSECARQDGRWIDFLVRNGKCCAPSSLLYESPQDHYLHEEAFPLLCADGRYLIDPTTAGHLHVNDAVVAIYRLASNLQRMMHTAPDEPLLLLESERKDGACLFQCTVNLPGLLPNVKYSGPYALTSMKARRLACYGACEQLHEIGALPHALFSYNRSFSQNDAPLDGPTSAHCYLRKKPSLWDRLTRQRSPRMYSVVLFVEDPSYRPLLLVTSLPFPSMDDIIIYLDGVPVSVTVQCGPSLELGEDELSQLHSFTVRLCRSMSNKPISCGLDQAPYFFAPVGDHTLSAGKVELRGPGYVAWDIVEAACGEALVPLHPSDLRSQHDLEGVVVQDRWVEFTRRYYVESVRTDLKPKSKPDDALREAEFESILDYVKDRRKDFEGLKNYEQPLIQVSKVPNLSNLLNPLKTAAEVGKPTARYLIPELTAKYTIPANVYRMALLLPSVTQRIDNILIAKELNAMLFEHQITEGLLLSALSAPSALYAFDYERLELLGDAFLKYITSIYVFVIYPAHAEGSLHNLRQKMTSNKALLQNALAIELPPYIQGKPLSLKLWLPTNYTLDKCPPIAHQRHDEHAASAVDTTVVDTRPHPDTTQARTKKKVRKQNQDQVTQWLGDKTIADVVEAIIGAAYLSGGCDVALRVMKALTIPLNSVEQWSDFGRKVLTPPPRVSAALPPRSLEFVEKLVRRKVKYPHLLAQALTHGSIQGYDATTYQRLEFLGDAILDFMVVRHIYHRDESLSPGVMTILKSAMVANSALAAICVWSGLNEHLLVDDYEVSESFKKYARDLKAKEQEVRTASLRDGTPIGQFWLHITPPKALSDVVESIIGALYISDGFEPLSIEIFFDEVLMPFYDQYITLKTITEHPAKILFDLLQAHGCQEYELDKGKGDGQFKFCKVVVHGTLVAEATSDTQSAARRLACMETLDALEGDPEFMVRTCDCRAQGSSKKKNNTVDIMLAEWVEEGE
ncbi:ribonuclease III [Coniophora puteana RWD-64-598 SS2]|uniref:Ribonuclease III n=1 Tax=Coniophora puteana (strain RWD-64-598) TaxID=741705 RepID=A0A5M3MTH9_CONPW|nr:ribonuclease III [Coniophora puteana RWD-64-598 SS2]EIW82390.1 ribonuclease III [Coniophora puteana RWD-64-598 SS2]